MLANILVSTTFNIICPSEQRLSLLKNTLSDLRYVTETQVSELLICLTVSWLRPSGKSRTSSTLYLQMS